MVTPLTFTIRNSTCVMLQCCVTINRQKKMKMWGIIYVERYG
ncbi:hypothetical protein SAMN06296952_0236 [Oscillospiraceae bacterium]|nr:hypothetical protein SAMN06296952_0236 [Oscillospiraceae bacterium]